MKPPRDPLAHLALVVVLAFAAGLPATRLPFGGDDQYILSRAAAPALAERLAVYTAEAPGQLSQRIGAWWMGFEYRRVFVRVVPSALVSLERAIFGMSPLPYHLVSLILHATTAALLYLLARRLAARGALVAALAFAAHPAVNEMVSWLAVTGTLTGTLLSLVALYTATEPPVFGRRSAAACVAATALAMTSYESVVALPLILLAFGRLGLFSALRSRRVELALPALLPLYAGLRAVLRTSDLSLGSAFPGDEVLPILFGDAAAYVVRALGANKPEALWFHGKAPMVASVPVVVVVLAASAHVARRHRAAALGLAIAIGFLAPPILVRATVGVLNWPTYRQVYPALPGLALVVAAAIPSLTARVVRIAAPAFAAIVPLSLAWAYGPSSTLWARNVAKLSAETRAALIDAPPDALVLWVGAPVFFPYSVTYDWAGRRELYLVPPPSPGTSPELCLGPSHELIVRSSMGRDPLATAMLPSGDRLLGRLRRAQHPPLVAPAELDLSPYLPGERASVRRESSNALAFSFSRPVAGLVVLEVTRDLTVRRLPLPPC